MQLRAAGGCQILQDERQNLAREEKFTPSFGHIDIADRFALDAAAHQSAQKIAVRERIFFIVFRTYRRNRGAVLHEPACVQILRQVRTHAPLSRLRAAEKRDFRAAQQLLREHLLTLCQKTARSGNIALRGR